MELKTGKIKYFNPTKQHGKIIVEGIDKDVYFTTRDIDEEAIYLLAGEAVEFELVEGKEPDSFTAKKLKRKNKRFTGIVLNYESGKGTVKCTQNNEELTLFYKDFIDLAMIPVFEHKKIVKIESGDEIEFDIEDTLIYGKKATRIFYDDKKPLERFALLHEWDNKIALLAQISPEPWDYLNSDPDNKFLPVLTNYLFYTFARLKTEERLYGEKRIIISKTKKVKYKENSVPYTTDVKCACFNTGLATKYQEEIFAYFIENFHKKTKIDPDWFLYRFCKASDREMSVFSVKPEWANYFKDMTNLSEILYDTRLNHELKYDHILRDRQERFPETLKAYPDSIMHSLLDQGLANARKRVRRNYKTAVPQYYNGKLQLLLPLNFDNEKTELALAVEKEQERYISRTVLKLEWAYSNARLIAKPDREWLDPVKEVDLQALDEKAKATDDNPQEVDQQILEEKAKTIDDNPQEVDNK